MYHIIEILVQEKNNSIANAMEYVLLTLTHWNEIVILIFFVCFDNP